MGTGGDPAHRAPKPPRPRQEHRWPRIVADPERPGRCLPDPKWCGCRLPDNPCREHAARSF